MYSLFEAALSLLAAVVQHALLKRKHETNRA